MRINGEPAHVPGVAYAPIPRPFGDIVFVCHSVLDYSECESLCPEPTPPTVRHRTGRKTRDYDDKDYLQARDLWAKRKQAWMVLKSLENNEWLSWDKVNMGDPETWTLYLEEFTEAGFSPLETSRVINAVYEACGLNQSKVDEAMARFLSGERAKAAAESSREDAANVTSDSELANV